MQTAPEPKPRKASMADIRRLRDTYNATFATAPDQIERELALTLSVLLEWVMDKPRGVRMSCLPKRASSILQETILCDLRRRLAAKRPQSP